MQKLEHIHLGVRSLEETERFLKAALPDYRLRGSGYVDGFGNWMHFGQADNYIAFTETDIEPDAKSLRHVGFEVDNIEAIMARLSAAGYEPSDPSALNEHQYRRRVYYRDANAIHWEFVEYLTDDLSQRNAYG